MTTTRTHAHKPGQRTGAILAAVAVVATVVLAVIPAGANWDAYGTRFIGLMLAAALWLVAGLFGALRVPERRDRPLLIGAASFGAAIVLATLLGYAPADMFTYGNGYYSGALTWLAWILVAVAAALLRPSKQLLTALLIAQLPIAAVAIAAIYDPLAIPLAGFDNSNHLVPGLLVAVPLSLGLATVAENMAWRIVSWVCAALSAAALAFAGSLTGLFGLAVALLLVLAFAPSLLGIRGESLQRRLRVVAAGIAVLAVLAAGLVAFGTTPLTDAVKATAGTSLSARLFYWNEAARAATARPILGLGADGFEVAAQRLIDASPGAQAVLVGAHDWSPVAGDAHNIVLTVLVCFGLVGFLAAAGFAAAWVAELLRLNKSGDSAFRSATAIAAVAWFVGVLAVPLSVQWGAVPAMVVGLALARPGAPLTMTDDAGRSRIGLAASLGVLAVAAAGLAIAVFVGTASFASAYDAQQDELIRALDDAVAAQPTNVYYRFVRLDEQGRLLDGTPESLADYHAAIDSAGPGILEDARYMALLVRWSLDDAYVTGRSDVEWEGRHLGRLGSLAPRLPELTLERAHLALVKRDADSARELLTKSQPYEAQLQRAALYYLYYARLTGNEEQVANLTSVVAAQGIPSKLVPK